MSNERRPRRAAGWTVGIEPHIIALMISWALLGWIVGVLVAVLADVLPSQQALTAPPRCAHCDTPRRMTQLSGIIAFALRQSRCAHCGRRIMTRSLLVEAISVALFVFLAAWLGDVFAARLGGLSPFQIQLTPTLLLTSLYSAILLLISVIDFEHRLILRVVIFPATVLALALSFITPTLTPFSAIVGGLSGLMLTGLVYVGGILFVRMQARRGRAISEVAFGQGDVWLMLFIGLIVGFPNVLRALVLGVLVGGVVAAGILTFGMMRRESKLYVPFAYGPYLAIAGWLVLIQSSVASSQ